jgi:hypothetical protein
MPTRFRPGACVTTALLLVGSGWIAARGQDAAATPESATPESVTAEAPPYQFPGGFDPTIPAPVSPYLYRGPGSDYARGPDDRSMPEYCYPGSMSPWCSMDDAPGPWSMPGPPAAAGDLWQDVHQPRRWWLSFAYLSIWTTGSDVPALVTTSPAGTLQGDAGVLPDATVLFGNDEVDDDRRDGGEVRLGYWLVDGEFIGVEAHYWATASQETRFGVSSDFSGGAAGAILARPFVNLNAGAPDAAIVAFPDFVRGGVTVDLSGSVNVDTTSILQSTGVTARHVLNADFERSVRVDLIGGYRFFQVDESLQIRDSVSDPGGGLIGPTTTASTDLFDTRNDFHSLEIGILAEIHRNRWTLELLGKCGLGNNHERVRINGSTTTTSLGTTSTAPTGLLAQPTNIGTFSRDRFAVLPEFSARLQFELGPQWRVFSGYRMMYFNELIRPGDQIDPTINTTQIGGPLVGEPRPAHNFLSTDMWLHGLDLGIEWRR